MATLILENVPADIYERLERRAAVQNRSLPQETLVVLRQALQQDPPTARLPELIPTDEVSAPCDLPRSSQPVRAPAQMGLPRLPHPPSTPSME